DFDGRYAYISPTAQGYVGNIMMILDLADPAKPIEAGRGWIRGKGKARGAPYSMGRWGGAALPPSAAHGRSSLCQLLASRPLHPRHFRHGAAEGCLAYQHHPGLPHPDASLFPIL